MQRAHRFRFVIIATIACAILLSIAAFSVSWAKWTTGGNTTATAEGKSGLFYVDYSASETLKSNTFYLQVVNSTSDTHAKYYIMEENTANDDDEYMVTVKLTKGQIISICTGSSNGTKETKAISNKTNVTCLSFNTANNTATCQESGVFSFYYIDKDKTYQTNKRDTQLHASVNQLVTSFKSDLTIHFEDGDIKMRITVNDSALTNSTLKARAFYAYMFVSGPPEVVLSNGWPGNVVKTGTGETTLNKEIDASDYWHNDLRTIKFVFGHNDDTAKTADLVLNSDFLTAGIGSYDVTFKYESSKYYSFSGADKTVLTEYEEPSYITASVTGTAVDEVATVRSVTAKTKKADSSDGDYFIYHNYISISRIGEDASDSGSLADNSLAFVEFYLEGLNGTNLADVQVKSVTLSRRETDSDGNPGSNYVYPSPAIYNYDSVTTLADLSHEAQLQQESGLNKGVAHYNKGIYSVLFFGDGADQYYALDLTIETYQEAEFILTATASNINHWQRFEQGYGQQWGIYMGGLFNNVWTWDPRRTTQMQGTPTITGKVGVDVNSTTVEGVTVYYPSVSIDYSLTVNLTAGSILKPYMLDSTGYRRQTGGKEANAATAYLLPKKIIAPDALYDGGKPRYNTDATKSEAKELNLNIPVSGEYTFRLLGKVSPNSNWYINVNSGESKQSGTPLSESGGWYGVPSFNFMVDELVISTTATATEFEVTFDLDGGKWDGKDSIPSQTVIFGGSAVRPNPNPDKSGKIFKDWYTASDEPFDFSSPVISDVALHAVWDDEGHTITFNAGSDGQLPPGVSNTVKTTSDGKLTEAQLQERTPVPNENRVFIGWFTAVENGDLVTSSYSFNSDKEIFALYKVAYTITFDVNGGSMSGDNTALTNENGYLTSAQINSFVPTPPDGSKEFIGWYTTKDGTTKVTASTPFNSSTTVYARYQAITITFNGNGGTPSTTSMTVNTNGRLSSLPTATRFGWTFGNWWTLSSAGSQIYTTTVFTSSTTVYAHWSADYYMVINSSSQIQLGQNGNNSSEYIKLGYQLSAGTNLSFYYGNTNYTITLNDFAANINTTDSTKKTIKTVSAGYYDIYLQEINNNNGTAKIYTAYSPRNTTGSYDIYIRGTWGNGGETSSWSSRKVASNVNVDDALTMCFYIPKNTRFLLGVYNHSNDSGDDWNRVQEIYCSGSGTIIGSILYQYSTTHWWTGDNSDSKGNKMFTFSMTVYSSDSSTRSSVKFTSADTRY